MGILKDRTDGDRELSAAPSAFPHALANVRFSFSGRLQAIGFTLNPAVWTHGAIRPSLLFKIIAGGIFIVKVFCIIN
jgi:hypothetical protein